jgi:transcriptional regulator with XRE-family HTH domain
MNFDEEERATRIQHRVAQREFAKGMKVSVSYLCKLENERRHLGYNPTEK